MQVAGTVGLKSMHAPLGDWLLCASLLLAGGFVPPLHGTVGVVPAVLLGAGGLGLLATGRPRPLRWLWLLPLLGLAGWLPAPARAAAWWLILATARGLLPGIPRLDLVAGTAALASLLSLALHLPQTAFLWDGLARWTAWVPAIVSGHALVWGEGPLLFLPLFFLARGLVQALRGGGLNRLAAALAAWILLLLTTGALGRWAGLAPAHMMFLLPAVGFLLFSLADGAAGDPPPAPEAPEGWWRVLPAAGAALFAVLLLAPGPLDVKGVRVGFRQEGLWSPAPPLSEGGAAPRLGGLMRGFEAWGLDVRVLGDSLLRAGPPVDVLFLVQPDRPLDDGLRSALGRWMEAGGVLVAVGEHTHVHGIGEGLGSLLQDYAIKLRDDCALPSLSGWQWGRNLRILASPATAGLGEGDDAGISVGASLDVGLPAWPLVTGILAFADDGDADNPRGRMGNTRWDPGERWGGVALAAAQPVGRGKLVVLGDKSPLMSLNNPRNMEWMLRLGPGAARQPGWRESRLLRLALLALCAAALVVLLRRSPARVEGMAALLLTAGLSWALREPPPTPPDPRGLGEIVWLDHSHQPADWLPPDHDWSSFALVTGVVKSGLRPLRLLVLDDEWLRGSRAVFVAGPARAYGTRDRAALRRYVESGGRLVVAVDGRRAAGARSLLEEFGFAVGDVPLGSAAEARGPQGPLGFSFWEAWDLHDLQGGADTLVSCWGYAVALRRAVGSGSVAVIGDERAGSRWFMEGEGRKGTWASSGTRFRPTGPPTQSRLPHPERTRYESRLRVRAGVAALTPPQGQAPGAPQVANRPAPIASDEEVLLRRAWFTDLLGLGSAGTRPTDEGGNP
jgi:hypothetical protein